MGRENLAKRVKMMAGAQCWSLLDDEIYKTWKKAAFLAQADYFVIHAEDPADLIHSLGIPSEVALCKRCSVPLIYAHEPPVSGLCVQCAMDNITTLEAFVRRITAHLNVIDQSVLEPMYRRWRNAVEAKLAPF